MKEIDLTKLTPDKRYLKEMERVVYDTEWFKTAPNIELYDMYRKTRLENGLRYDITVIHPTMLGKEFAKTKGHIHAGFYGEVYVVLEGEGLYLAQKTASAFGRTEFASGETKSAQASASQGVMKDEIEDVFVVHGKKGDVIIIPAGYGHVTINPTRENLKTANWVAENDKGNFEPFERNQGACYYYLSTADGKTSWVKNEHYKNVPLLRFQEPLKEIPSDLNFLKAK